MSFKSQAFTSQKKTFYQSIYFSMVTRILNHDDREIEPYIHWRFKIEEDEEEGEEEEEDDDEKEKNNNLNTIYTWYLHTLYAYGTC